MTPPFGMGRPHDNMPTPQQQQIKRGINTGPMSPVTPGDGIVTLSFNVPFASSLAGPEVEEVVHASPGAVDRWTHPEGTAATSPSHTLPVHVRNEEILRKLCRTLTESFPGRLEATVTTSEPKPTPASQRLSRKGLVTNVCISGEGEMVHKMRAKVLNETPIALVYDVSSRLNRQRC